MSKKILLILAVVVVVTSCRTNRLNNVVLAPSEKPVEVWREEVNKHYPLDRYKNIIATDSVIYIIHNWSIKAFDLNTHKLKWKYTKNAKIKSKAVLDNNFLFFTNDNVLAYNITDGKEKRYEGFYPVHSEIAAGYGLVYFDQDTEEGGKLRCADAKTGKVKWEQPTGGWRNSPIVADSMVVIPIFRKEQVKKTEAEIKKEQEESNSPYPVEPEKEIKVHYLGVFNAINGQEIFRSKPDSLSYYYNQYTIGEEAVVASCLKRKRRKYVKGYVVCFDYKGNEKWRFQLKKTTKGVSSMNSIIRDKRVYVFFDKTYVLDLKTGKELWQSNISPSYRGSNAVATSNALLILANKKIYALNSKTGEKMWELKPEDKDLPSYKNRVFLCPNIIDKTIYVICGYKLIAFK